MRGNNQQSSMMANGGLVRKYKQTNKKEREREGPYDRGENVISEGFQRSNSHKKRVMSNAHETRAPVWQISRKRFLTKEDTNKIKKRGRWDTGGKAFTSVPFHPPCRLQMSSRIKTFFWGGGSAYKNLFPLATNG